MSDPNDVEPPGAGSVSGETSPTLKAEAQQVLDELWGNRLIPFALKVGKITKEPIDDPVEYVVHFHDSRIRTARLPLTEGEAFKHLFRASVLARVKKMSGPLR